MQNDIQYINYLDHILKHGTTIQSRNSIVKRSTTIVMHFSTTPLITVRTTAWKNALREMEWFLSGSSNIKDLHPSVQHWWKPWADPNGDLRNNYSEQFTNFCGRFTATSDIDDFGNDLGIEQQGINQIDYLINNINSDPFSRRHVITTWNTADMIHYSTKLTNCHGSLIQAFVENNQLNLVMYQRSADMALGVPHNIIQYWALLQYLAHKTNKQAGIFTWIGGDCHIYNDHIEVVKEMIDKVRSYNPYYPPDITKYETPQLIYTPTSDDFKANDFTLDIKYEPLIKKSLKMVV